MAWPKTGSFDTSYSRCIPSSIVCYYIHRGGYIHRIMIWLLNHKTRHSSLGMNGWIICHILLWVFWKILTGSQWDITVQTVILYIKNLENVILVSFLSVFYWFFAFIHLTLSWWRHQMEPFSALLALCAGNPPVTGEFPTQRPVTRSFDVFCDLRLNKPLSKQSWAWWFETPLRPLWRHSNVWVHLKYIVLIPSIFDLWRCLSILQSGDLQL